MTRRSFRVEIESGRRWRNEPLAVNLSRGFRRGPVRHRSIPNTRKLMLRGRFEDFRGTLFSEYFHDVKTLIYFSSYIINNGEGVLELESGHC